MAKQKKKTDDGRKTVTRNRQAFRNYAIEQKFEAGIVLVGTEVKSIRAGQINLSDAYAEARGGELFLLNCHIAPYSHGTHVNHEPLRRRKLLMHGREIERLQQQIHERGMSLIPLEVYLKKGRVKVELGLGKGKKLHDKRDSVRERETKRDIEQALKRRR